MPCSLSAPLCVVVITNDHTVLYLVRAVLVVCHASNRLLTAWSLAVRNSRALCWVAFTASVLLLHTHTPFRAVI
eukprot:m.233059 g.233059  ORF g.233059 m.233059 type:complete len:74 (+) comp15242_c1_seq1:1395-1616(+)